MNAIPESPQVVLEFWFGKSPDLAVTAETQAALWWSGKPQYDQAIREQFADLHEQAVRGGLVQWEHTAPGLLALIILVDQFSRTLFRGDARAFAHDGLARGWCRKLLDSSLDRELRLIERVFAYLPLEHSESREDQQLSLRLFGALHAEAAPAVQKIFASYADFARRHQLIVEQFGRFPHRNAALGRLSTEQEAAFLMKPGSSF